MAYFASIFKYYHYYTDENMYHCAAFAAHTGLEVGTTIIYLHNFNTIKI